MDKLLMGLSTTATGMLVVFSGLMILIGCIYVMTLFTARPKKKAAPARKWHLAKNGPSRTSPPWCGI